MPQLPYLALPPEAHFGGHVIVVYGIDENSGEALIADRARRPVRARLEELAAARGSKHKPFPPKHKLLDITPPAEPVSQRTLERAILRGISDSCRQLLHGPIRNIGLQALRKWADLVVSERDPKGWRKALRRPVDLYAALMNTYLFIEISGTGGSAFRSMYASFLSEAAAALDEPKLEEVSCLYRKCARLWTETARAALPDWAPGLRATRELLAAKNRIFEDQASGALESMLRINEQLDAIVARAKKRFPVEEDCVAQLLDGLREAILKVYDAETEAVTALRECVR
jgi:hypothetical protein